MNRRQQSEEAVSPVQGTLLMVALTIILALIVWLLCSGFTLPTWPPPPPEPPSIIITEVQHINNDPPYNLNYESRVTLRNNGTVQFENDRLTARFYRDGEEIYPCVIETLNGANFIPTPHYGVQTIKGSGCQGMYWNPNERIWINLNDGTLHPGDLVTVEIFDRDTGKRVSRHSYTA